jgi:hypothetical protein
MDLLTSSSYITMYGIPNTYKSGSRFIVNAPTEDNPRASELTDPSSLPMGTL